MLGGKKILAESRSPNSAAAKSLGWDCLAEVRCFSGSDREAGGVDDWVAAGKRSSQNQIWFGQLVKTKMDHWEVLDFVWRF